MQKVPRGSSAILAEEDETKRSGGGGGFVRRATFVIASQAWNVFIIFFIIPPARLRQGDDVRKGLV